LHSPFFSDWRANKFSYGWHKWKAFSKFETHHWRFKMSDIVFETTHTDEAAVASQIKDAVSAWSNRIPHHNFRNFGERITVRSIVNRPAYYIALQTQYENREVKTEYMPFRGQELPQRNYATAAEVDFWADFFAPIENFTNHTDKLIIPGSQYRSTCHSCSGEGKITCPKCDGHKEVKCHSCGGKGHRRCETCGGVRTRNCTHCGGSGKQSIPDAGGNYPSCSHCSGGKIPCPSCEGRGTRPCGTCARTGYVPCGNCNQTGFVKCKACDGQGYLYHFLRLYRHLTTEKTGTTVFHPDLDDVYKQLKIDKSRLSQLAVLNQSAEQLDDDAVAQAPFLQQSYTDVLSSARQKASSQTRIQMQQLIVYRWDVFVVDYTYNDEALALVVHGPNDDVIAPDSPIERKRSGLGEEAEAHIAKKRYVDAYDLLSRAGEMDVDKTDETVAERRSFVFRKIEATGERGMWLAMVLSGLLFWFFGDRFFTNAPFYLPWLNQLFSESTWMAAIHPPAMKVTFILLMLVGVFMQSDAFHDDYFKTEISSNWLRFSLGLISALWVSALFAAALLLANYAGLTLPFTYAGYVVDAIWQLLAGLF
jgi:hypothetical protein